MAASTSAVSQSSSSGTVVHRRAGGAVLRLVLLAAMLVLLLAGSFVAVATTHSALVGGVSLGLCATVVGCLAATYQPWISLSAAALTLIVLVGGAPFVTLSGATPTIPAIVVVALAVIVAWVIGESIRHRRRSVKQLQEQAAAQAVLAERLRIARELHDVIAHSVGVIAIQAGMGRRVIDTQPDEARSALRTVETLSREALARLRSTLRVLRGGTAEPAPAQRGPGLADLDRLAAATAGAGIQVEVAWRGQRRPIPADVDQSAYWIVQESLTNVVRHARVSGCRVTIDYRDADLTIEVVDDGRGGDSGTGGYGIIGMRERVDLLHGEFAAGPRCDGGFRVTARLPTPAGTP